MVKILNSKKAIITGATSGIGKAIAIALINEGTFVYLIGRDFTSIEKDLSSIKASEKNNIKYLKCDLSDKNELNELVNKLSDEKQIDMLIHCAGTISVGVIENENIENLDEQYAVNVRAPYYLNQKLLSKIKNAEGDIVFINSTAGLNSWENIGQYSATKHAKRAIADSLRKELKNDKVRVSSLFLGSVDTPMQKKIQQLKGSKSYNPESYISPVVIADLVLFILKMPSQASVTDITVRQNI